eukprot:9246462-Karenia_brevis.AAC.1
MKRVLKHYAVPLGLQSYFAAQYLAVISYLETEGAIAFFCVVTAGVIQGDPGAAMIFTMVIDSGLWLIHLRVVEPGYGHAGGCADDIAVALRSLEGLIILAEIFGIISGGTCLELKIPKCVL